MRCKHCDTDRIEISSLLTMLHAKIAAYDAAADKFIAKCDDGRVHSVETYQELQAARRLPE